VRCTPKKSGRSYLFLWPLLYGKGFERTTPVYGKDGAIVAQLRVVVQPGVLPAPDNHENAVRLRTRHERTGETHVVLK